MATDINHRSQEEPVDVQAAVAAWLRHSKVKLDNLGMRDLAKLHEDLARDVERGVPVEWHRENVLTLAKQEGDQS